MNDLVHTGMNWLDHNRYVALAVLLLVAVTVWTVGCSSMTRSIIPNEPGRVNATQLEQQVATAKQELTTEKAKLDAEATKLQADLVMAQQDYKKSVADHNAAVTAWNAKATEKSEQIDAARADLAAQDVMKQKLVSTIGQGIIAAANGGLDPANAVVGLVSLAGILLGGGALLDNRRKDSLVTQLKIENDQLKNGTDPVKA